MKKYLLLVIAVFSFTFAQAQGFKFGVKGGVNYSNLTGKEEYEETDFKTSFHLGAVGLYEFDDMFGIKPELLYSSKGYQFNQKFPNELGGTTEIDSKVNLNYVSLPILLNVKAGGLFFELGPEVSYLTAVIDERKENKRDATGNKVGDTKTEDYTDKDDLGLASMDFGYVAGIGYMLPMGLNFGLRYNGGIKSIFDSKDMEDINARNNNFQFSIGYMFGGGDSSDNSGGEYKSKTKIKSE